LGALHLAQAGQGRIGPDRSGRSQLSGLEQARRQPHHRGRPQRFAPLDVGTRIPDPIDLYRDDLAMNAMNHTAKNPSGIAAARGAGRRALQWRLLLLWIAALLIPTAMLTMPLWQIFSEQLDHTIHAA